MARAGWEVDVIEKHATPGGRARKLTAAGFTFDMGPSWYWMPDVFDRFFAQFGAATQDFYSLQRLDPSYRVYWEDGATDIPASYPALLQLFESLEPGSSAKLEKFLAEAAFKYKAGMQNLVFKPGQSLLEFLDRDFLAGLFKLDVFTPLSKHIHKYFTHPRLRKLLEFPVLFLGALPADMPALYSLMNYADMVGGTWYPSGGMYSIVSAIEKLALRLGVRFHFNETVERITLEKQVARGVVTDKKEWQADAVIAGVDYHHAETDWLPPESRSYSAAYWEKRTMAPSCLLYYVGVNKKIPGLLHHSLFFDTPFDVHADEIYRSPQWPSAPMFYLSSTSVTDPGTAPDNHENLFLLVPVAAGLEGDTDALRDQYFEAILSRVEQRLGTNIKDHIVYYRSYAVSDFISDYNAFKGNAYGLANTLMQTAILKPSCRSKKVKNLFYTGQLTVPGPGVPPSLISGEIVAETVIKYCR